MNATPTLLLTGAAGLLGRTLHDPLRPLCAQLILSDLPAALQSAGLPSTAACDLSDAAATDTLLQGVDTVVHFGGIAMEGPFEPILQANIRGMFNLYEAARRAGTRRIVFASSNHITGCYPQGQRITPDDPVRPDSNYGVSKLFGEGLARMYFDRYGIESVCLRLGTCTLTPPDRRSLATWISPGDLVRLVCAAVTAPDVGFLIAYGVSANPQRWWECDAAWAKLGFAPQDSAEPWASEIEGICPAPEDPCARLQGGSFLGLGPFD
ncbi:NAD(P)-dependent oxidoreductase [Chitinimonas sp. BJYL2]|uniref:NAD-dependent epimerase/dehydratase family protein n=1 Tax=Chitinimonas sp. BJYL2 TaxID=2976696 RepID=UPI0022B3A54F|nr:NAD(P)-dependent oxidoreductase [Chitinimonas sp. BJYL2]